MKFLFNLCRYYKTCKLYQQDGFSCNDDAEAKRECGKYRELKREVLAGGV